MVRGKTVMRRIENATSRQVTFSKRRNGLLKKAHELSVLCDAEIALIVFSPTGKLYEFSSSSTSMQKTIERYRKYNKEVQENSQQLKYEAANLAKEIENLEASKRKLMGEGLESCSINELEIAENQLEKSLLIIRGKKGKLVLINHVGFLKNSERTPTENQHTFDVFLSLQNQLYREHIEQLKQKEEQLLEENEVLWEKRGSQQQQNQQTEMTLPYETSPNSHEVETKLHIGWPERR
ncbi:hypothetical protein MKW92_023670 [Papaver armeniacum]|nr:hypothetical protein MKW92_023670 [Papaver armeniacum]